ncbi:MAG: hypothetical protein ACOVP4_14630 [Bacteriovoracaceae bacterium]
MNKNWLIRTKSNHILGPVSKDKVIELYKNGSIKGDDEVCSANGFWFFIREKDLIEKYLLGNKSQTFNPISEAKDVLTSDESSHRVPERPEDDVTLVGKSLNLKDLQDDTPPPVIDDPEPEKGPEIVHQHVPVHDLGQNKKKITTSKIVKKSSTKVLVKKDHSFIKYFGIFTFVLLLLLIYFRKTIMTSLSAVEFIPSAHAQTSPEVEKKKPFLDQTVEIDNIVFRPLLSLEGLRIISVMKTETLDCAKLNDEVTQLGIILYPQDQHNESFLKRVRDCVLPLEAGHPVKRWLKEQGQKKRVSPTAKQIEQLAFLDNLLNSGFNLITAPDQKVKIVSIINDLDETHLPERILQSYLYLLLGNVAQSDLLLAMIYKTSPFIYWSKYPYEKNIWSDAISLRMDKIFERLSKHPADRTNFQFFSKYMFDFFNDENLREVAEQYFDNDQLLEKIKLKVYQKRTGDFAWYLRYKMGSSKKRREWIRKDVLNRASKDFPWYWYFFDEFYQLPKNEKVHILSPYFEDPSTESQLYFQFMAHEDPVLETFYQSKGLSEIKLKRQLYIKLFQDESYWWISLFHLIEMGNINEEMVKKIMSYEDGL